MLVHLIGVHPWFTWASSIVSGICCKQPANSWMSSWQKQTLVVALVVVPFNCTPTTHPSNLSWSLRRNRWQAVLEQLSIFLTLSLPDPESSELVRVARSEAIISHRRADQNLMVINAHTPIEHSIIILFFNSFLRCQHWKTPSKKTFPIAMVPFSDVWGRAYSNLV